MVLRVPAVSCVLEVACRHGVWRWSPSAQLAGQQPHKESVRIRTAPFLILFLPHATFIVQLDYLNLSRNKVLTQLSLRTWAR